LVPSKGVHREKSPIPRSGHRLDGAGRAGPGPAGSGGMLPMNRLHNVIDGAEVPVWGRDFRFQAE
jgi:hypothetical protein